ncbi:30S ribosomal protein S8 [Patescibacteria group bacterium]
MSIDRLSNMLSSIKNAVMAGNSFIETVHSKECESVAKVLKSAGFLSEVKSFKTKGKKHKGLRLELAKEGDDFKISDVKRISKPGRRLYMKARDIRPVSGGFGILVLSTSRGIMEGMQAKQKKLGGEILCEVS